MGRCRKCRNDLESRNWAFELMAAVCNGRLERSIWSESTVNNLNFFFLTIQYLPIRQNSLIGFLTFAPACSILKMTRDKSENFI